jgi:hypothetical protein
MKGRGHGMGTQDEDRAHLEGLSTEALTEEVRLRASTLLGGGSEPYNSAQRLQRLR